MHTLIWQEIRTPEGLSEFQSYLPGLEPSVKRGILADMAEMLARRHWEARQKRRQVDKPVVGRKRPRKPRRI